MKRFSRNSRDAILVIGGTSLRVYFYLLLKNDEVGVRELQKALGFKSPSTAKHHLDRLVELGLAEKTLNGYKAIASSNVFKKGVISFLNNLIPLDLFLGFYGLLSVGIYVAVFIHELSIFILPLIFSLLLLSGFLIYRGLTLYRWYEELLKSSFREDKAEV
ncbi:MAG: hypothetical protein LM588_01195 [Fervidicoccaceae archaeon]|jgi:DNA-binding transcriptional ArsR family regulator|nr:hypothetical protein [Fervidicoccaceae archaeon]